MYKGNWMFSYRGFTLIELIIFIAVLGIIGTGLILAFNVAVEHSPDIRFTLRATELAKQRMDIIIGQKHLFGFAATNDPCATSPDLAFCQVPSGFTVTSSIVNGWGGSNDFKVITVTTNGLGSATITGLVANV